MRRIYVAKASSGRGTRGSWLSVWRMRKMTSLLFFGLAPMKAGVWRSEVWSLRAQALRAIPPNSPNLRVSTAAEIWKNKPLHAGGDVQWCLHGAHVSPLLTWPLWRPCVTFLCLAVMASMCHPFLLGPYGVHVSPLSAWPL